MEFRVIIAMYCQAPTRYMNVTYITYVTNDEAVLCSSKYTVSVLKIPGNILYE